MLCDALSSPMTVSAQVVRMARIPNELRGRSMTFIRTLINGTTPAGSAIAAPMLAVGAYRPLVVVMTIVAALPGAGIALAYRSASFGEELGLHTAEPRKTPSHRRARHPGWYDSTTQQMTDPYVTESRSAHPSARAAPPDGIHLVD